MEKVLNPKSAVVIGASKTPNKVGNVILRNLIERKMKTLYAVNPKYQEVLGIKCFPSVKKLPKKVDCAIIATPAATVPKIVKECGEKGIKGVIIITSGFEEVGNHKGAQEIKRYAKKYGLQIIGPNCLGVLNMHGKIDTIFLPSHKLERPKEGAISFLSQSGAVGSVIIDMLAHYGIGVAKFISYGNATATDESDLLEYLGKDKESEVIVLYVEGVKDGRRFYNALKKAARTKKIIVLKGGKEKGGQKAAKSHTGNIAGSYTAYQAAFKQSKVIEVEDIEELFDILKLIEKPLPKGERVGVITNGGGLGIMTADEVEKQGLKLAEFEERTKKELKKILPPYGRVGNPLDLVADADVFAYERALAAISKDRNTDMLAVITLLQTPKMDDRIVGVLTKTIAQINKPLVVISLGGEYTEAYIKIFERSGVPTYTSPKSAIKALKKLREFAKRKEKKRR